MILGQEIIYNFAMVISKIMDYQNLSDEQFKRRFGVYKRLFGNCYAMDGGYKGWNPYRERHLAIFVNYF